MNLFPIDQDDKLDAVNTKEKLKDFLKQSGLLWYSIKLFGR